MPLLTPSYHVKGHCCARGRRSGAAECIVHVPATAAPQWQGPRLRITLLDGSDAVAIGTCQLLAPLWIFRTFKIPYLHCSLGLNLHSW